RIHVDDGDAVRGFSVGIEGGDVGERFGRRLRRLARRGIKSWIGRPGGHMIFSSRDRPASSSSRLLRIAQADPSATESPTCSVPFFSELGSGLRDRRAGVPRIRGYCSSAALVAYIEPEWTLVPGPFLCVMANSGCFAAAGTATAVMAPGRTKSGV